MGSVPERPASADCLPLPTLLSQALVAFTIELDNEAERRIPHRTTRHGSTTGDPRAPWLVSVAMWSNCLQFIGEGGVRVRDLERIARTPTNLNGLERWGYVVVAPDANDRRAKPPRADWVIRATSAGRTAQDVWRPLFDTIETRWRDRFGADRIDALRSSLSRLVDRLDPGLPDCLPILGFGLFSRGPEPSASEPAVDDASARRRLSLLTLLARPLLAFAIEFERQSALSLAVCANVVRALDERGTRLRDLPAQTGVSAEAIAVAIAVLVKGRFVVVDVSATERRMKMVRLTTKGRDTLVAYRGLLADVEERWRTRFGDDSIREVRGTLEPLVDASEADGSPLFRGLDPYPDGWRASVRRRDTLPHFPMVLHRGGFPDGS